MEKEITWLSLSDAAALLGVHPSTVRLWSDKGALPVHKTKGGHRRYRRAEVELWAQARNHPDLEPGNVAQNALGQVRLQISESHLETQGWYQKLGTEARESYRRGGKALVFGMMAHLNATGEESVSEAEAIGYEYASRARSAGLSLIEAVEAFLFFRNLLAQSMIGIYQNANIPSGKVWGDMMRKTHEFTDIVLLKLLATYKIFEEGHK